MTRFAEAKCQMGGCGCGAWADWFEACNEADPVSLSEERDPMPLANVAFDVSECAYPETCRLAIEARAK